MVEEGSRNRKIYFCPCAKFHYDIYAISMREPALSRDLGNATTEFRHSRIAREEDDGSRLFERCNVD